MANVAEFLKASAQELIDLKDELDGLVLIGTRSNGECPILVANISAEAMNEVRWLVSEYHLDLSYPRTNRRSLEERWSNRQHNIMLNEAHTLQRQLDLETRKPVVCECGDRFKSQRGLEQHKRRGYWHRDGNKRW